MKKLVLEGGYSTIDKDIEKICFEAGILTNMVSTIKNIFPDFLEKISTSFSHVQSISPVEVKLTQTQQFVIKHINEKEYLELADLMIMVPEGFVGSFPEYADALNEVSKLHMEINNTVLKPFIAYLSHFISNKDAKLSIFDTTDKYVAAQNIRKNNLTKISSFINNTSVARAKLGSVVSRKADILDTYNKVGLLTQTLKKTDLKLIQDHVKNCLELLNMIVEEINKGNIKSVTPEVTKNLAFSTLQIAEEIEFMALVHFKALGLTSSVDSMTAVISDFIKEIH